MNLSFGLIVAALGLACSDDTGSPDGAPSAAGTGGAGSTHSTSSVVSAGSGAAGGGGDAPIDPCSTATASCPTNAPAHAGDGLVAIDRCAYPLDDTDAWADGDALVASLGASLTQVTLGDVLATGLNRDLTKVTNASIPGSPAGLEAGFRWEDDDETKAWWIPQGITASSDASANGTVAGKKALLVSSYYKSAADPNTHGEKGSRIAIIDMTDPAAAHYRLALLVAPVAGNPVDFAPVVVHAGGLAWAGHYLYVVDTHHGFRVFDLDHMFVIDDPSVDSIGYDATAGAYYGGLYKYVVPQVGAYETKSACDPLFSFVSVDRSTSPPSLVSGEYCATDACAGPLAGRLLRWTLNEATGRLAGGKTVWPSEAFFQGETQVQGAASSAGSFFLSSSAPGAGHGVLYLVPPRGPSQHVQWIDSPEDLVIEPTTKHLWSLSEAAGKRYVIETAYQ